MRRNRALFFVLVLPALLLGASEMRCEPVPLSAEPTLETDARHYVPGEAVTVRLHPNGTPLELNGTYGYETFQVEFGAEMGAWLPVRTLRPMGCYPTDCVDGVPLVMCVDPGPPFCQEVGEDYDWVWDGHIWIWEEQICGDETIEIPKKIAATMGSYRVRLEYGEDPTPGDDPTAESCAPQDHELISDTFEITWLRD